MIENAIYTILKELTEDKADGVYLDFVNDSTIDKNKTSLISVCHFFTHVENFFKRYSFYPNNVCSTGITITNKTVLRVTTFVENSTSPFP